MCGKTFEGNMNKEKAIGLFRLKLHGILEPLKMYGQQVYVLEAEEKLIKAALKLHDDLIKMEIKHEKERAEEELKNG